MKSRNSRCRGKRMEILRETKHPSPAQQLATKVHYSSSVSRRWESAFLHPLASFFPPPVRNINLGRARCLGGGVFLSGGAFPSFYSIICPDRTRAVPCRCISSFCNLRKSGGRRQLPASPVSRFITSRISCAPSAAEIDGPGYVYPAPSTSVSESFLPGK